MTELNAQERGCISLAVGGPILAAAFYAFGFGAIVIILNEVAVPPLGEIDNFGQFGFLIVYIGFFGGIVGAFSWLLVLGRWAVLIWIPIVIGGRTLAIVLDMEALAPSFTSVIFIGQLCLDLFCILLGSIISIFVTGEIKRDGEYFQGN